MPWFPKQVTDLPFLGEITCVPQVLSVTDKLMSLRSVPSAKVSSKN